MGKGVSSSTGSLASLTYRSRAAEPMTTEQLRELERAAQARNRSEGLSGHAVYDGGRFFQWLEGPADALARVWSSVSHDPRHTDIVDVRILPVASRVFGGRDMALSIRGERDRAPGPTLVDVAALGPLLSTVEDEPPMELGADPAVTPMVPILRIVSEALVVPEVFSRHGRVRRFLPPASPAAERLASLLLANDPRPAAAMVRKLYAHAGSLAPLCATVLEPAARALGDRWLDDGCHQLTVTTALCRLQTTLRQLTAGAAPAKLGLPVVLVVPQAGEVHTLGAALDAELLWQAGWDTHREFPETEDELYATLSETWFDVLDLTLSPAMLREDWLPRMAATIAGARAASKNPALTVVTSGRVFFAHCDASVAVGADASTTSALQIVLTAASALRATRAKTAERSLLVTSS